MAEQEIDGPGCLLGQDIWERVFWRLGRELAMISASGFSAKMAEKEREGEIDENGDDGSREFKRVKLIDMRGMVFVKNSCYFCDRYVGW